MLRSLLVLSLLVANFAIAADVFDEVAGRYPVYVVDGNEVTTGVLEVRSSDKEGVGYQTVDLFNSPDEAAKMPSVFTPKDKTVVKKEGKMVVQEFQDETVHVRIEYTKKGNQLSLATFRCPTGGTCQLIVVNEGAELGEAIDATEFFNGVKGKYKVEKVAGKPPHAGGSDFADISVGKEEANLTMPYCKDAGGACDPGYIDLTLGDTKVYQKPISEGRGIYTIVSDGKTYTLEGRSGTYFFRNYQYEDVTGVVQVLTHELTKKK